VREPSADLAAIEASFAANQKLWDAWTAVHAEGPGATVADHVREPRLLTVGQRNWGGRDKRSPRASNR
jgi:hypothetical protein